MVERNPRQQEAKSGSPEQLLFLAPILAEKRQKRKPTLSVENPSRQAIVVRFPNLLYRDERIKYDPTNGDVYIGSWRRKKPKDPNLKSEALRRWTPWGDIEVAIRGATHIVEKTSPDGDVIKNLQTVHDLTLSLFDDFTTDRITPENISDYLNDAVTILEENHLIKPTAPNKQLAIEQIIKALRRDSIQRHNPLISRTRLASAAIKLIHELFIAGQTQQKYNLLLTSILHVERETERLYLRQIVDESKELLKSDFRDTTRQKAFELQALAYDLFHPNVIKVAPYRKPAIMFAAYVFGFPKSQKNNWEKLFSQMFSPESVEIINKIHGEGKNGDQESFDKFKERLAQGIQILDEALVLGERNLKKES